MTRRRARGIVAAMSNATLQPLSALPAAVARDLRWLLCDIDDTVTTEGNLPAASLLAMERLQQAGVSVLPHTRRPAGWCDHIARMWPVDAVVGENGALYFRYDRRARRMIRRFWKPDDERIADRRRLEQLRARIVAEVPGAGIASDQPYREADLAVDFCEDVPALPRADILRIKQLFEEAGAHAKISSIHVNGWFGDYDKLAMTRRLFAEQLELDLQQAQHQAVFAGDSPNDAPMFGFFDHSVGVRNVLDFKDDLAAEPTYVSDGRSGAGFVELAERLVALRGVRT